MINLGKTHAKLTIFPKMFCKSGPRSYGGATCGNKKQSSGVALMVQSGR